VICVYDILVYLAMAAQRDELYFAILAHDYDAVVLAVEGGNDVNRRCMVGNYEFTYLYLVCERFGKDSNCAPTAIKIIGYLISKGADVNAVSGYLRLTPLHFAAYCGYIEYVEVLLESGASFDICDIHGRTAPGFAESNGHHEIAAYIRSYNDIPVKGVNS